MVRCATIIENTLFELYWIMKKIVLASNNQGKLNELTQLFAPLGITLIAQSTVVQGEAAEPHCTFIENALAKARFASRASGLPALADDAGLCIDAWQGRPGVDTAHYAESQGFPVAAGVKRDTQNVDAVLASLSKQKLLAPAQRRAAMVSTLVAIRHPEDPEPLVAVGRVGGEILQERRGGGGFGFDPVFFLPGLGKTFAELPDEEKNRLSHRGLAARKMLERIRTQWLRGEGG
jgi:XTP/dITP diphosphohydrolase